MISVKTLAQNKAMKYYIPYFGPFAVDDSELFEDVSFRSSFDDLRERPGLYGDNHVNHREVHADLYQGVQSIGFNPQTDTSLEYLYRFKPTNIPDIKQRGNRVYSHYLSPAFGWRSFASSATAMIKKVSPVEIHHVSFSSFAFADRVLRTGCIATGARVTILKLQAHQGMGGQEYVSHFERLQVDVEVPEKSGTLEARISCARKAFSLATFDGPDSGTTSAWTSPQAPLENLSKSTPVNFRSVRSRIDTLVSLPFELPTPKAYGDLAVDAIETLDRNTINMFEFLQGIRKPWEMLPKLKNLSKLRTHAGNYLGYEYGVMPTIDDFQSLVKAITSSARPYLDPNGFQIITAGSSVPSTSHGARILSTRRIKIALNTASPSLQSFSERLRDIGGFPSVNNLYELIPYSFVLDWFIDVGGYLERIDADMRMAHLPIMYCTTSSKTVIHLESHEILMDVGFHGDVSVILYDRAVSNNAPRPTLNFEVSNELPNHWLEAGALIIARTK